MNRAMQEKWPWIEAAHHLRAQLLDRLSDPDLAFTPGGANLPLEALLREAGEIEYSYLQIAADLPAGVVVSQPGSGHGARPDTDQRLVSGAQCGDGRDPCGVLG